jgi:FtsP/CotA-like multicopper oxidase with cupredoxin domain/plastocyanin
MVQHVRKWIWIGLLATVALVATGCAGGGGTASGGEGDRAAAAAPAMVQVTLSDFKIEPAAISVPSGQELMFHVENTGSAAHTFGVVAGGSTLETSQIQPGNAGSLTVPALDPGSYKALCTVPGHDQLGMVATVTASEGGSGGTEAAAGSSGMDMASGGGMTAQEMAAGHQASVEAFPAETQGTGNEVLAPKLVHGVKVFTLTATQVQWEVSPGVMKQGMAFNGQIPGPQLQVGYGDDVRIIVQNQMDQPTVLHLHGMTVPNAMDGVPYLTQDPIMPGQYWTYEFTVQDPPGMYVYHSHFNSTEQVEGGLYGSIIVEPAGGKWPYPAVTVDDRDGSMRFGPAPRVDVETTLFLGDGALGYVINGKSFPATQPIVAAQGDWVLIHMANDGSMLHPMHLHGYHFEVVAQDGFPLREPYMADTLVIAPGQRFDVLVHAVSPGAWAFHCHILPHVEGPQGMYGMVTALVVE